MPSNPCAGCGDSMVVCGEYHHGQKRICEKCCDNVGRGRPPAALVSANILVLCHGNLNRSPAAEKILRKHRPGLEVQSAGVNASQGQLIAAKMRRVLESCGYESSGRSRRVTREMVEWADMILVMDEGNASRLMEFTNKFWCGNAEETGAVQKKIRYVGDLLGLKKISDPHFSPEAAHHHVVRQLEQAFMSPSFDRWLEEL